MREFYQKDSVMESTACTPKNRNLPVQWLDFIWEEQSLPSFSKLIAAALRSFMNSKNQCAFPSLTTLQRMTGLARSTLCKYLDELDCKGWLRRIKGDSRRSTVYHISFPQRINRALSKAEEVFNKELSGSSPDELGSTGDELEVVRETNPNNQYNNQYKKQYSREATGACSAPDETQLDNTQDEKTEQVKVKSRQAQIRSHINILVEPRGRTRALKAIQRECKAMTVESITSALFTLSDSNIDVLADRLLTADEVISYLITVARNE